MSNTTQIFAVKTSPKTVLEDYSKLMHLAQYEKEYDKNSKSILKLNLRWSKFLPS